MTSKIISAGPFSTVPLRLEPLFLRLLAPSWVPPSLTLLSLGVVWELSCQIFAIPEFLLPAPSAISYAATQIGVWGWVVHIWATLRIALIGYVLAIATSIPLAIILVNSKVLSRSIYPILVIVQTIPVVAVAPILVVLLGVSDAPRIVITWMIAFFPLVVSTATGMLATPEELIELSRSLRAGRGREFTQIRLPFAVPYIFGALKVSITLAAIGAVVAEFVAAEMGLGYLILFSTSFFKVPLAFASLSILVLLSLTLFGIIGWIQARFFAWSLPT